MTSISTADWRAGGAFMTWRGHQVFWREAGAPDAPVLLLIHGFPTSSWDWTEVWPELARHYRLLTLDMIGFGLSDKPADYDYSIVDQANLLDSLLALCAVRDFHILAHDYGDTVAQELIARDLAPAAGGATAGQASSPSGVTAAAVRPRPRLRSVALLNGGLFPETHRPLLVQRLLLSPLGPFLARRMSAARLADGLRHICGPATPPSPAHLEGFWEQLAHHNGPRVMPRLIGYIPERRLRRERWVGALRNTRVPLKLINGPADPISGAHMVARYRELVPNPDVTELDGIGHYPQVEAPAQVLGAYLGFRAKWASQAE